MTFHFCPDCGGAQTVRQQNDTKYTCASCVWTYWNNAKAATAIAFVKDDQLLVVERAHEPNKGKFELAGGFVDFGEDAYSAAIREAN